MTRLRSIFLLFLYIYIYIYKCIFPHLVANEKLTLPKCKCRWRSDNNIIKSTSIFPYFAPVSHIFSLWLLNKWACFCLKFKLFAGIKYNGSLQSYICNDYSYCVDTSDMNYLLYLDYLHSGVLVNLKYACKDLLALALHSNVCSVIYTQQFYVLKEIRQIDVTLN